MNNRRPLLKRQSPRSRKVHQFPWHSEVLEVRGLGRPADPPNAAKQPPSMFLAALSGVWTFCIGATPEVGPARTHCSSS